MQRDGQWSPWSTGLFPQLRLVVVMVMDVPDIQFSRTGVILGRITHLSSKDSSTIRSQGLIGHSPSSSGEPSWTPRWYARLESARILSTLHGELQVDGPE